MEERDCHQTRDGGGPERARGPSGLAESSSPVGPKWPEASGRDDLNGPRPAPEETPNSNRRRRGTIDVGFCPPCWALPNRRAP